ncbi:hypothetical protein Patl1_02360 [Pistacia atlantica]|uniref:Uncharacterized protein n=1 Tax=Pistacia atlantica TaxID=434234 RepID=A0ACC1C647_9ROSI|nr:hypothetical protein Patl1_02360 [Pistacia atlantica]
MVSESQMVARVLIEDHKDVLKGLVDGTKNLAFLGGDMFKAIPSADAILLKITGVEKRFQAKKKGGKVIIIELAIGMEDQSEESTETQLCFDMLMMSVFNTGKERSVKEWKKLFLEAGFTRYKITPILGLRSLIELYP